MRTVILGGGRSQRMGFDKLTARFNGAPFARRVALGLRDLEPVFVTTPEVAEAIGDVPGVRVIVTSPTAGPSATLAIANAAIDPDLHVAVLAGDLPFLDADRVRAFVARVPDDADMAWPVVGGTPGHPVLWSPKARARIRALRADEAPSRVRSHGDLRAVPLDELDDAYVTDVDTPAAWAAAEVRATRSAAGHRDHHRFD